NLAQGFQTFSQDPKTLDESLALIFGDLSPSSASAHMNYLITLLKSVRLRAVNNMTRPLLSEEGVFYALRSICQRLIGRSKGNVRLALPSNSLPNLLTNQGFTPQPPLATPCVPGSGCVLYDFTAGLASGC
ncbi:hypothetical protein, partial [Halomonas sp. G11]|uniref:hypothetical protein n=1 Tax=Halomonas sp. G11 TaxID=1684425 RepID=UPI001F15B265